MGKLHLLKACSSLSVTLSPPSPINMTTSALRRQVKNIVHNYSEAEIKVREATSNDPWGPSSSLMSEIADLTFNVVAFAEVMGMVWKRLNDSGKNWRHVYKALTLLDYLLKTGSERVAQQCRENAFTIQTLRDFQYVDRDGRDQGANVREKARQLVCLLRDDERLRQERSQALKTKERMAAGGSGGGGAAAAAAGGGGGGGGMYGGIPPSYHPGRRTSQPSMAVLYGEDISRSRGSPSSFNSASSSSPRAASDLEQARPQTSGEEELQLQLALAMSREESQKEKRCRQGDESLLRKVLDESRRENQSGTQEATMVDLADLFAPPSERQPPTGDPWNSAQPSCNVASDPWDFVAAKSDTPVVGSPWTAPPPPSIATNPWAPCANSCGEPWEASAAAATCSPANHTWDAISERGSEGRDAFSAQGEETLQQDIPQLSSPASPTGLSAPSPTNPFHCDQPRLTLNQMRPSSTSPMPPHMISYSPSLPLPLPHRGAALPSSLTQPPAGLMDLPSNLPRPLLPLSPRPGARTQSPAQTHGHNPFL
ncbi:epsin-2 isoform X3 [Entelurus aequoreus]|uniref:epsin-2 isoform X3 n=1 Tax=Entelurus aequoreus TaxID=161455 RepID=UPI002B1E0F6F|nr:epsin-2 isoform X3 [Entelurus aequoreus]